MQHRGRKDHHQLIKGHLALLLRKGTAEASRGRIMVVEALEVKIL